MSGSGIGRRRFAIDVLGGLAALAALGARRGAGAAERARAGECTVYPQQVEGPFYLDGRLLRRDITEGRSGAPLTLKLQVVSARRGCAPLAGLAVDVWHCDAAGLYSGYPGQLGGAVTTGETFLRGTQITDDEGRVEFQTIYPGWYPGRTTHVHFKVHLSRTAEAVSQLYFPEDVSRAIYASAPYRARGQKDTSNASDGVVRYGGLPPLLSIAQARGGASVASARVAVAT
jgi:protocatechuate 3,4-dioxygenase beta subunit